MRPIYEKDRAYNLLLSYCIWSMHRTFKKIEINGEENIPEKGAFILSPNHVNTLLDALVILALMQGREVAFAARADIFKKPLVAKILNFLRIMPINRIRDGVDSLSENEKTFATAVKTLKTGMPFCMFPEGRHSQEPGLLPLRKGIARIALRASSELDEPVYLIPVGLVYEDYENYRTSVQINVGEPITIGDEWQEGGAEADEHEAEITDPAEDVQRRRARKLLQKLAARMQVLINSADRKRINQDTLLYRILNAPLLPIAAISLLPAFGIIAKLKPGLGDKAFLNSIRYAVYYVANPIIWLVISIILLIVLLCIPMALPIWARIIIALFPAFFAPFAPGIWHAVLKAK